MNETGCVNTPSVHADAMQFVTVSMLREVGDYAVLAVHSIWN